MNGATPAEQLRDEHAAHTISGTQAGGRHTMQTRIAASVHAVPTTVDRTRTRTTAALATATSTT